MPVVTSERYKSQLVGMGVSVVEFDENGVATRIVQRMNDHVDEPIDDGVVAQARKLPDHFNVIEDHEIKAWAAGRAEDPMADPELYDLPAFASPEAEPPATLHDPEAEAAACAAEGCPAVAPAPTGEGETERRKRALALARQKNSTGPEFDAIGASGPVNVRKWERKELARMNKTDLLGIVRRYDIAVDAGATNAEIRAAISDALQLKE